MKVALTGATGFVGSHVLTELQGHGHDVMALVRDEAQAEAVTRRGRRVPPRKLPQVMAGGAAASRPERR